MFGTSLTGLCIAALAGVGAYFAWASSKALALFLGVVCFIAAGVATLTAFLGALGLFFKLMPFIFLALGLWLVWRALSKEEKTTISTR